MRKMSFVVAAYVALLLVIGAAVLTATEANWKVMAVIGAIATLFLSAVLIYPTREPTVLLVGRASDAPVAALREELSDAGFELRSCPGPAEDHPCPVTLGRSCPMRDHLLVAMILRPSGETAPTPPCGQALHIPWMAVEEGSTSEPEVVGPYARVGLARGPDELVHVLEDLIAAA
jgi:hypothetical protein